MSKHKQKEEEQPNFQIRPPFSKKFKPGAVKVNITFLKSLHLLSAKIFLMIGNNSWLSE